MANRSTRPLASAPRKTSPVATWQVGHRLPIRCGQMIVFCSTEGCHSLELNDACCEVAFFWEVNRIEHNILWVWYIIIWKASRWRSSNAFYFGLLHLGSIPTNLLGTMQHPLTIFDPINFQQNLRSSRFVFKYMATCTRMPVIFFPLRPPIGLNSPCWF